MDKGQLLRIIASAIHTLEDAFVNSDHEDLVEDRVTEAIMDLQYIKDKLGADNGQV